MKLHCYMPGCTEFQVLEEGLSIKQSYIDPLFSLLYLIENWLFPLESAQRS
jgi:hypothetical protein